MEKCGHYQRWQEDFDLVKELGIEYLRYGPPYYRTHLGPGKYDWAFADETFHALQEHEDHADRRPVPLRRAGLDRRVSESDWPKLFAEYARAFAQRFPWVRFYTPVNEIFIAATFSAQLGWWNERLTSDRAFVNALKQPLQGERAGDARDPRRCSRRPSSSRANRREYFHAGRARTAQSSAPILQREALPLARPDLRPSRSTSTMYEYLLDNGMTRDEYHWFRRQPRAKPAA